MERQNKAQATLRTGRLDVRLLVAAWIAVSIPLVAAPRFHHLYGGAPRWVFLTACLLGLMISLKCDVAARLSKLTPVSSLRLLAAFLLFYSAVFLCAACWRVLQYQGCFSDNAILCQAMWNTLHGRFMETSVLEAGNHLTFHNSPLMLSVLPFYALWPAPVTVLAVQTLFIALAGYGVYVACRALMPCGIGLVVACGFLLCPTLAAGHYTWHDSLFALGPLALAYGAYLRERPRPCLAWLLLGLAAKEDALLFAGAFLVLALIHRRSWRWIVPLALVTAFWALFTLWLFSFRTPGDPTYHRGVGLSIAQVYEPETLEYLYVLLRPYGLGLFTAVPEVLLALPNLAVNVVVKYAALRDVTWRFSGLVQLGLILAFAHYVSRGCSRSARSKTAPWASLAVWMFFAQLSYLPYSLRPSLFAFNNADVRARRAAVQLVPPRSSVAVTSALSSYFANREVLLLLTEQRRAVDGCEYLVYDERSLQQDQVSQSRNAAFLAEVAAGRAGYGKLLERNGVFVWRRSAATPTTRAAP